MSQSVTFLSLCSLIQIYYFENGPNVTVTSQIISRPNFIALFYFTLKLFTKMWFLTFIKCQHYVQLFWSCPYDKETVENFQLFFFFFIWNHLPLICSLWKALIVRNLEVDGCQSNLHVMLKLLFFE